MNDDLISNHFTDNIDRVTLRKYVNLLKTALSLSIIFTFLESLAWYTYLKVSMPPHPDFTMIYNYRIAPLVGIAMLIMSVLSWAYYLKGNKLIYASAENNDATFFNEGVKSCYRAGVIAVAAFIISITIQVIRFIIANQ